MHINTTHPFDKITSEATLPFDSSPSFYFHILEVTFDFKTPLLGSVADIAHRAGGEGKLCDHGCFYRSNFRRQNHGVERAQPHGTANAGVCGVGCLT